MDRSPDPRPITSSVSTTKGDGLGRSGTLSASRSTVGVSSGTTLVWSKIGKSTAGIVSPSGDSLPVFMSSRVLSTVISPTCIGLRNPILGRVILDRPSVLTDISEPSLSIVSLIKVTMDSVTISRKISHLVRTVLTLFRPSSRFDPILVTDGSMV